MTPQENLRRALLNDEFPDDVASDRLFTPSGADALRTNRNIALSAWMTQVSGQDINAGSATWQHDKDALVQGFFKNPTASNVSDEQLHGLVKSHIQTAEDAATLAADGALTGEPLPSVIDAVRGKRGASPLRPIFDRYEQDAMRRHTALTVKLAPYRSLVNQVAGELGKEMEWSLPTTDKFQSVAERLLSVPAEDRMLVLKAIGATGGKDAKERARYLSKLAGSMGRMSETMGASAASAMSQAAIAETEASLMEAGQSEFAGRMAKEGERQRDFDLLTQQIRTTADQEIDPIKGDGWWSQTGIDVARMLPQSAITIANPALGMAANYAYFENTIAGEAMLQDPRLTPDQARSIAGVSAPLNAVVETVTALIPFGRVKLPFVQKWLQATATSLPTTAARFGVRAAAGTAAEIGEEYIQAWTPLKAQELLGALQKDMPNVDWENRMPKFADIAAQTWGPALVFSLVGAGSVSISEVNSGRALAMDRDLMIATGIAPAKADAIAKSAESNNWRVVDAEFRDIVDKPAVATDAEKAAATQRFVAKMQAQQQTEVVNSKEAADLGVRVFRDAESWKVETAGGSIINADSAEAARRIRDDIKMASTEYEAETMVALVDGMVKSRPDMRVEIRPEIAAATSEGIEFTDPITGKTTKISDAKSFQNLRDQAAAVDGSQSDAPRLILGDNYFEFAQGIARVFRRERGTQSVPQMMTAAHEVIENSFRRGLVAGQWTEQDAKNAIGSIIPALEAGILKLGAKATAEEKSWLDNAKRAVAEGDSNLVREVISELGVRTWIGRDRDGNKTGLRPGTILRALDAAILQEAKPENVTTYQRLRAWFKAVGAYLKGVVATAKIIRDAERNGTIDDFTGFLDKVLGIEAATREENEVKQDVQDMAFSLAPETKTSSLSPQSGIDIVSDTLESWQDVFDKAAKRNPTRAMAIRDLAQQRINKLGQSWASDRWTAKGDKIRAVVEKRTKASLDTEQSFRETLELDAILAEKGMTTEEAQRSKDSKDYEAWQRFQESKALILSKGEFTEEEANKMAEFSSAAWRKSFVSTVRDAVKEAKSRVAPWREEADDMQADDWSPRESLVRDMRVLNVALSAFPAEVRAKVTGGSMVKLAGLATERARYKAIKTALDRAIVETEKFMRKEYTAMVKAMFAKYEPDAKSGDKPKGKLGADVQEIYDAAKAALGLSAEQTQAELARLDSLIAADGITPEQELNLTRQRGLVELLGDWKNADSGRMAAALEALEDTLSEGWASWKLRQILIREGREESRKELRSATKKKGLGKERDAMRDEAATTLGKASSALLNLSSFSDVMKYAFGAVGKAKEFINRERIASNAYEDAIQAIGDRVQDFFTSLGGGSVIAGERIRYDLAHSRVKVGSGDSERNLTQLQGIQALLMWQQEDGRRHMEGPKDENGAPIEGKWSYDESWIADLESKLTPEAKAAKLFLQGLYSEEWAPLNAIYREIHGINLPRHDLYAPLTVKPQQAKAGEMVDPVSGAAIAGSILTPGSLRSRNRTAQAEPDFRDALAVFLGHSKQMEHWKNYYNLAVDLSAVLGNREVMNAVEASIGSEGVTVLKKWIDAIAQGGFRDAAAQMEISQIMSRLAGRAATVALLGRTSTLLVQSTQLAAASVRMPVGAYLKRFGKLMSGNLGWGDAIKSDFIQRRIKQAPPIVRQAMNDLGTASRPNAITGAVRFLGNLLSGADGIFTGGTYAILLDWHRTQGAKMGMDGAELDAYAHDMAATITEEVAQPVRMANRSLMEIANTGPMARVSWAYSSEARQKIALFFWSANTAKSDPVKFAKTSFLTFIVGGLMSQVLKNLWREAKGDDDEKKWSYERLRDATIAGPLHGIPFASEIMGNPGQLSSIAWSKPALEDIFTGEADMRDVETLFSVAGYFNDNLAGIAALSNLGFDFAKVITAATEEEQ